jgi:hypothetical protein
MHPDQYRKIWNKAGSIWYDSTKRRAEDHTSAEERALDQAYYIAETFSSYYNTSPQQICEFYNMYAAYERAKQSLIRLVEDYPSYQEAMNHVDDILRQINNPSMTRLEVIREIEHRFNRK